MERLLLATDLCANSDRALERAIKLAIDHKANLYILHILPGDKKDHKDARSLVTKIENMVKECLADIGHKDAVDVIIDVLKSNKACDEIQSYAYKINADLIIMGMHRKARFLDVFMSTTFSKVLLGNKIPMLMVKGKPDGAYKSIICGYDFAPTSTGALLCAMDIAPEARFDLIHAYEKPHILPDGENTLSEQECGAKLKAYAEDFSNKSPDDTLNINYSVVKSDPYRALIDAIEKKHPDMICVGTHGNATTKIGPVTNSLMADPPCDILVLGDVE